MKGNEDTLDQRNRITSDEDAGSYHQTKKRSRRVEVASDVRMRDWLHYDSYNSRLTLRPLRPRVYLVSRNHSPPTVDSRTLQRTATSPSGHNAWRHLYESIKIATDYSGPESDAPPGSRYTANRPSVPPSPNRRHCPGRPDSQRTAHGCREVGNLST